MDTIRVIIVEDSTDWITAITSFLKRHTFIEVVATASSRKEAINVVSANDADVVIMDINLNDKPKDGIFCALDILMIKSVKIIMLSSLKDSETIKDAFTAGAIDYLLKDNFNELPETIRKVCNKNHPHEVLLKEFQRLKREDQLKDLTPAEKDLFDYLEKGTPISKIEAAIFKTQNTLKRQINSILKKLNVNSSREAIQKVNSGGLSEIERKSGKEY